MAENAYYERALKQRSIVGETNRPMAYNNINDKVRNIDFNELVNPYGTLNLDQIDNNQFQKVKSPEGIYINSKTQSRHNQSEEHLVVSTENPDLHPVSHYSKSINDIAQGMRLALGIAEPVKFPLDRMASRQLSKVIGLNRPVENKSWSKQEIEKYGVYKY